MKRNTLFTLCAITALGIVMAGPASASDSNWVGGASTDWADADNWSAGVPGSTDTATINPFIGGGNEPLITADATVGRLVIGSLHSVTVQGAELTLDGTTAHDIDGLLILSNSSSSHLKFSDSVTVGGTNDVIQLNHASSEIRIADGKTLTLGSNLRIEGMGKIVRESGSSTTSFVNNGTVLANAAGPLSLGPNVTLTGSGDFNATTVSGARLEFYKAATTGLSGNFTLSHNARLKFLASITTTGIFTTNPRCGLVDVDTNASVCFKATGNGFELCDNQTYSTGCP